MTAHKAGLGLNLPVSVDLIEADILEAMKKISGYLDIIPRDFKEVYYLAYQQAVERLSRELTAREVMTKEVTSVQTDTPLAEVAEAMGRRGISGVPVLNQSGRVEGVISEKDFLSHMGGAGPKNFMSLVSSYLRSKGYIPLSLKQQTAKDIMSSPAVTVEEVTTSERLPGPSLPGILTGSW